MHGLIGGTVFKYENDGEKDFLWIRMKDGRTARVVCNDTDIPSAELIEEG